jgi:peptidoglycan-associated lipoprotein
MTIMLENSITLFFSYKFRGVGTGHWRSKSMIKRLLPLFAASLLLAACETASTVSGDGSSEVQSSSSTASNSASATEAASARTVAENQLASVGNTVLFGFDSASLTDAAQATLNRQAAFMQASPTLRVIIGGHADERGTREYNLALAERRAAATRDYLVAKGVNAARVRIISYGKERPVAVGSNDVSWAKNRRAVTALN